MHVYEAAVKNHKLLRLICHQSHPLKHAQDMTMDSFAAAQQRIAARRLSRLAEVQRDTGARKQQLLTIRSRIRLPGTEFGLGLLDWLKDGKGTRPAFRVGQLDAELLDDELLDLLKNQIGEGLKLFGVCIIFGAARPRANLEVDLDPRLEFGGHSPPASHSV